MTSPSSPNGEQLSQMDPETDSVVVREDDEGLLIEAHVVSGGAVDETNARTYTRTFGHYFISSENRASDLLDELFSEFAADHSILTNFQRPHNEAYELIVEVVDSTELDAQYDGLSDATLEIPSHSQYIQKAEEVLDEVRSDVTDA